MWYTEDVTDRRKDSRPTDPALLEKYFHSMGALAYDDDRLTAAIRFFRKALKLSDLPYIRCHLGLAYFAKGDLTRATAEMTRAIDLAPSVADYRYKRSLAFRAKGDLRRAGGDLDAAISLDPNYERIEEIRRASENLQKVFGGREEDEWLERAEASSRALKALLSKQQAEARSRRSAVENRSCLIRSCPAYCCHFRGETVLHGLCFGPWKLRAVRAWIKEKGLKEEDVLGRLCYGSGEERLRLIPPQCVVKDGGERVVFYPAREQQTLAPELVRGLPKTLGYQELAWITTEARACAFLERGRCVIHDLGGDEALPACKEFLCLTGYVFLVLDWLGLAQTDVLAHESMEKLNRFAVEALLSIDRRLYGNTRVASAEKELQAIMDDALEADGRGDVALADELAGRLRTLRKRYRRALSRQKALLREDLDRLS